MKDIKEMSLDEATDCIIDECEKNNQTHFKSKVKISQILI
jgi:hypothetical protein